MISIIIPSKNNINDLKQTLRGLVADKEGHEVIVVDNGSVDGSVEWLGQNEWIKTIHAAGNRAALLNAGAKAASGETLLFLLPGLRLTRGWPQNVEQVAGQTEFTFGAFTLDFDVSSFDAALKNGSLYEKLEAWLGRSFYCLPACGSCLRNQFWNMPLLNQGLVIKAEYFQTTNGFMDMPLAEDMEWVKRAGKSGAKPKRISGQCINPIRPYVRDGEWTRLLRNGKTVSAFLQDKGIKEISEAYEGENNAVLVLHRGEETGSLADRLKPYIKDVDHRAVGDEIIRYTLRVSEKSWGSPKTILSALPEAAESNLKRKFGDEVLVEYQRGNGLGEQISTAMTKQFDAGLEKVLLIDPICPTLDTGIIGEAIFALDEVDVVLGPTDDGECYLVGCRAGFEELLGQMDWNSESSFQALSTLVRSKGGRSKSLPRLRDIDNKDDFREFFNMGFIQY